MESSLRREQLLGFEVGSTEIQPPCGGGGARGRKCRVKRREKQAQCTEGFCNSPLGKQSWEASSLSSCEQLSPRKRKESSSSRARTVGARHMGAS